MADRFRMQLPIDAKWQQLRGQVQSDWSEVTDEDLDQVEGRWDRLVSTVRERTGQPVDRVEARLRDMVEGLDDPEERP